MFINTDILRAALCCVADKKESRRYLQGVHITSTHIQACDGHACVSMEHGSDSAVEGVFILNGEIPEEAEGTFIKLINGMLVAEHITEDERIVGRSYLESVDSQYPSFCKALPAEPEPCDALPTFQAKYLALPQQMFGRDFSCVAVKFKPYGKEAGCQLIFDDGINYMYGNPFMVIMPLRDSAFEKLGATLEEVLNEESI